VSLRLRLRLMLPHPTPGRVPSRSLAKSNVRHPTHIEWVVEHEGSSQPRLLPPNPTLILPEKGLWGKIAALLRGPILQSGIKNLRSRIG